MKKGKAWAMADTGIPPSLPEGQNYWILRLAMRLHGKDRCDKGIPPEVFQSSPSFVVVATDRKAMKMEIATRIDQLFDVVEAQE